MAQGFLIAPGTSADELAQRRRLAEAMVLEGRSGAPLGHWTQGLNRALQGAIGGYQMSQMRDERKAEETEGQRLLAEVLSGSPSSQTSSSPVQYAPSASPAAKAQMGNLTDRIINAESGGNANARNPNSTATGSGQFINSTWLDMIKRNRPDIAAGKTDQELLSLRSDPNLSRQMVDDYSAENATRLQKAGIEPTDAATYLAHFAGPQGAVALLQANPATPVGDVLGAGAVKANPWLSGMTAGDMLTWAQKKVGGGAPAAPQAGPAAPQMPQTQPQAAAPQQGNPLGIDPQIASVIQKLSTNRTTAPLASKLLEAAITPQSKVGRYRPSRQGVVDTVTGQIVPGTETGGADAEFGTAPQYLEDAEGNVRIGQLSKAGGMRMVDLPEGTRLLTGIDYKDTGTEIIGRDRRTGAIVSRQPKDIAGKEAAEEEGVSRGKATTAIPKAENDIFRAVRQIDEVLVDPALSSVTGWQGSLPTLFSSSADMEERLRQIGGGAFSQAFETLKGGGAITEAEGRPATAAIARLEKLSQSDAGYVQALKDARTEMWNLYNVARRKAGMDPLPEPPLPGQVPGANAGPQPGDVEDGFRFKGGDPRDPNSWEQVQ